MKVAFLAASLLLSALPARAELRVEGAVEQGGLVLGRVAPGAEVMVGERSVRVTPQGAFLFGLDRDAPAEITIVIRHADGSEESRRLAVARRDWPIQRIDGLPPKQVAPDPQALIRIRAEAELMAARRRLDTPDASILAGGFQSPVDGAASGVFGSQRILNGEPRAAHSGMDIAAPAGTAVVAAAAGTVTLAHPGMYFTGRTVLIDHGYGLSSVYAHLQDIVVVEGQTVSRGEPIGRVGASGRATGPHLHWGVSWFDVKLDPASVLHVLPAAGASGK